MQSLLPVYAVRHRELDYEFLRMEATSFRLVRMYQSRRTSRWKSCVGKRTAVCAASFGFRHHEVCYFSDRSSFQAIVEMAGESRPGNKARMSLRVCVRGSTDFRLGQESASVHEEANEAEENGRVHALAVLALYRLGRILPICDGNPDEGGRPIGRLQEMTLFGMLGKRSCFWRACLLHEQQRPRQAFHSPGRAMVQG